MAWRTAMPLALWLLGSAELHALDPARRLDQYSAATWTSENGLPNSAVQGVAQTGDGYLWIATLEGVARFDGHRFQVFDRSTTHQIPRNDVQRALTSRDGSLWLAIYGGGLVRYREGAFRAYTSRDGLPVETVVDIADDATGALWIATGQGLFMLRDGSFTAFTSQDGLASDYVRCLFVDADGTLWVGTNAGLDRYDGQRFQHYAAVEGSVGLAVNAIGRDGAQRLWVGTHSGLRRLEGERLTHDPSVRALDRDNVSRLMLDRAGAFWIATDSGLARLHDGRLSTLTAASGLTSGGVSALLEDHDGSLWVGTSGGLTQLKDGAVITYSSLQGLSSDDVLTLAPAARGGLWLGSSDGRLDRLEADRVQALAGAAPVLRGSRVLALLDEGHSLWVGTDLGLHRLEAGRWSQLTVRQGLPPSAVRSLLRDRRGRLWIGTEGGGLACLENGRVRILDKRDGLPSEEIRGLLEGRDGTLWIATYGGLSALAAGGMRKYTTADGLSHDLVRTLHEDERGVLWIGTYGGGLSRLENGRLAAVTSREGLFSDVVYQIVEDDRGRLWMSSNRGVFSVARAELDDFAAGRLARIRSVAYGRSDGMRSPECNGGSPAGLKAGDGRIWFATTAGAVVVDATHAGPARVASPPHVEEASVDGQRVSLRGRLLLRPGARRLHLAYSSVELLAPERTRFAFQLEGFDADWIDAGTRRSADYTGLPPGDYRFRVRALNEGGAWHEAEHPLQVRVQAHWYRERGFQLSLLGAIALAAWGAHRLRLRRLIAREQELARRVDDALAQIKVLSGLLPICSGCKSIRDEREEWRPLEAYLREHTEASFSHGLCPSCLNRLYPEIAQRLKAKKGEPPVG